MSLSFLYALHFIINKFLLYISNLDYSLQILPWKQLWPEPSPNGYRKNIIMLVRVLGESTKLIKQVEVLT